MYWNVEQIYQKGILSGGIMRKAELAKMIDHTLLGPTASTAGVEKLCQEAKKDAFASVCVNPCHAALAHNLLEGTAVKVCVVIGFPHGMTTGEVKAFEAQKAVAVGAEELSRSGRKSLTW
jgi:deoxyribose-phosphate aldolase